MRADGMDWKDVRKELEYAIAYTYKGDDFTFKGNDYKLDKPVPLVGKPCFEDKD